MVGQALRLGLSRQGAQDPRGSPSRCAHAEWGLVVHDPVAPATPLLLGIGHMVPRVLWPGHDLQEALDLMSFSGHTVDVLKIVISRCVFYGRQYSNTC